MHVIFDTDKQTNIAMSCFYEDEKKQSDMMHRQDIDKQVKEWQETHSGNPPRFYTRITIREFTQELFLSRPGILKRGSSVSA